MKKLLVLLLALSFAACGGESGDGDSAEDVIMDQTIRMVEEWKNAVENATKLSELDSISSLIKGLDISTNQTVKNDVENISKKINKIKKITWKKVIDFSEKFSRVKDYSYVSFPALKGDTISLVFSSDVRVKYEILEERSKRSLVKGGYASDYNKKLYIPHDDVYTLYLKNNDAFYYSVSVERKSSSVENQLKKLSYHEDSIVLEKPIPYSEKGVRLTQSSVFYEPEMRVLDNSMLSYDKTYLPIEVPKKTIEILYRLEVTDAAITARSTDDNLYNEVSKKSKTIKLAGKEIWSSESSSTSLTREILNSLTMPEQRDETVDMYFIDTEANLKKFLKGDLDKFLNGSSEGEFEADLNYSSIGTPSKNGLIKNKNNGFYYLAVKGTSSKDVKIWIDVLALYEESFDYIIKRSIIKE
jgi:hypothetical protein